MTYLQESQYGNSSKYNARIFLHHAFGTNQYSWPMWIFDNFQMGVDFHVLEIGCGNGLLWKINAGRIPENWSLRLSDFSEGMLNAAKSIIGNSINNVTYEVIEADQIPHESRSFDMVIANHMLYHIPDRNRALSEINRVLKDEGVLYATTMHEDYMKEMKSLIAEYRSVPVAGSSLNSVVRNFSVENGRQQLELFFNEIELRIYPNVLMVNEAEPFVDYAYSLNGMYKDRVVLEEHEKSDFMGFVREKIESSGNIMIPASAGLFICRNSI